MKNIKCLATALFAALLLLTITACKTPTLEPGGVYAPTNAVGQVIYNDTGLALADASYKFAYESTIAVFKFEKDNRAAIFAISKTTGLAVKHALDKVRDDVWMVDQRWATARKSYRANPTPAGLSTIQTILAEIQRIIPVAQGQLAPVYQTLATGNAVKP